MVPSAEKPSTAFALSRSPRPPEPGDLGAGEAPVEGVPKPGSRAARRWLGPRGHHLPERQEPLAQQRQRYPQQAQTHQAPHGAGVGASCSGLAGEHCGWRPRPAPAARGRAPPHLRASLAPGLGKRRLRPRPDLVTANLLPQTLSPGQ